MLGLDSMLMSSNTVACATEAFIANRTFFISGNGVVNATPSTDYYGATLTMSASGRTKYVNTTKYWPTYDTSLWFDSSGFTTSSTAFNFIAGTFTLRFRAYLYDDGTSGLVQPIFDTGNGFGSWGSGGLQSELRLVSSTTIRFNYYSPSGVATFDTTNSSSIVNGWHEFMIVFDGTNLYGYVDGVKCSQAAATMSPINQPLSTRFGTPWEGSYQKMYINDFGIFSSPITTSSSYTLPVLPPC